MKSIKIFFLATVAIVAGLFTACSDDDFKAGPEVDGAQVYFPENVTTQHSISDDVSSIAIPVKRIAKDEALTVAVLASDESGLFTIPSSVSFAAGKETSELLITFDRTKLEDGKEYPLSFLINDEDNTTPYGNRSLDITVMPWPWVKMGTGKFREGWLSDVFTGNMFEIDVTVHSHKSKEGIYMVEEMLGWPYMTEFFGATQEELSEQFSYTPSNIVIDCSNATQVTIEEQWSGITENSNGYGNFMIASAEPGTLVNGVITFPKDGLTAKLVGLDREFSANSQGTFRIMLPGAEIVDYTLSAAYAGMKVSADGETASAVIDFTYGADVTGISYVLASGNVSDTADEIAAAIAAGTAENIYEVKDFAVGAEKVSVEAELEASGVYTVIALPKNKAGKLLEAEASASSFFFPGKGGSSAPECDLDAMLGLVSVNWPEQSADCPDESSLYFEITGSELESLFTWLTPTANLEALLAEGASEEELIDAYGTDQSAKFMPSINSKGGYGSAWINLLDDTSYTMLVKATNIYGKSAIVKANHATAAIPYSGALAIGRYRMSYSEESGYACENVFRVHPTAGSATDFFVSGLGDSSSTLQWYATYDSAAGTLTLDGQAKGYESYGNIFGGISSNYDPAGTYIYTWWSYVDPEGDATNDPLVFKVDASTKQLSELNTYLHCPILDANDAYVGDLCFFPIGTAVTAYTANGANGANSAAKVQGIRTRVPFSSVRVPANAKFRFENRIDATTVKTVNANVFANGVRTLSVKTAKCEPLPKQIGRRADFKIRENLPVLK
ncbi:hypothetical protein [uncultured Alistipes sp.]|uniref:hypothetical protein n=1 Tax=uncultured Alistipes sp. TaxID=538949 RepID=UPI002595DCA7|nr:hypothetical protein [uncultured Alistipes sp.]